MAAAEDEGRRQGVRRLWLSTRLAMTANRRLFASLGFAEAAQHAHPGYHRPTFVDMEKPMSA